MTIQSPIIVLRDLLVPYRQSEWGFTGTRKGMTGLQRHVVRACLSSGDPAIVRHGGAHGADTEFHALWREECPTRIADIWPAEQSRVKLFDGQDRVTVNPVLSVLARNTEIVKRSVFVIAVPHTLMEERQSGTWSAIRCARRYAIPILICWPNGLLSLDYCRQTIARVIV